MSERKEFKRTLVTTALPYANGPVHIGHLAGVYVPADVYVRYLRLRGDDVIMIGGSDEHGVPITLKAKKEGVTPQDVVDKYHGIIKDSSSGLVFRSTSTRVPPAKPTTKQPPISLKRSTTKALSLRKSPNNITMKWPTNFWPTVTLPAPAPIVTAKAPMATSARNAAPRSTPPTSSIQSRWYRVLSR